MKKLLIVAGTSFFLLSCGGGGNSASKLANEVCDCYEKANGMDAADPKRTDAQNECVKMQGDSWAKVKDDMKKSDEYNKIIGDCGKKLIEKSIPK